MVDIIGSSGVYLQLPDLRAKYTEPMLRTIYNAVGRRDPTDSNLVESEYLGIEVPLREDSLKRYQLAARLTPKLLATAETLLLNRGYIIEAADIYDEVLDFVTRKAVELAWSDQSWLGRAAVQARNSGDRNVRNFCSEWIDAAINGYVFNLLWGQNEGGTRSVRLAIETFHRLGGSPSRSLESSSAGLRAYESWLRLGSRTTSH